MSLTVSILVFLAGAVTSGLLFRLLRRRMSETIANGLSFMVLMFGFYPLALWITGWQTLSITLWIIASAMGAITTASINSILRPR